MIETANWYLRTQDEMFGPETKAQLVEWARLGRILPGQEVSDDNVIWQRVEDMPFLDMRFSIDIGDGNLRGPFNQAAAEALLASGRLPPQSKMVEVREPFPEPESPESQEPPEAAPAPEAVSAPEAVTEPETALESEPVPEPEATPAPEPEPQFAPEPEPEVRIVEKVVRVEVPVEKIVEKIVEKEVRVEVPVEKIVEKVIVDETRVNELETMLAEERRHTTELQARMDEMSKRAAEAAQQAVEKTAELQSSLNAATAKSAELECSLGAANGRLGLMAEQNEKYVAALKDATDRENKYAEQLRHLEDELRRLPQAASEVADIQAAVFAILQGESEEIAKLIEVEKCEFEEFKRRHAERSERMLERRRQLLRRSGSNIEEMTRRALIERPEDPRTAQLRKELDELRRVHEHAQADAEKRIRELSDRARTAEAEAKRSLEGQRDITQLLQENQLLREKVQVREQELLAERQRAAESTRQEAARQQALLARLASLESPSIGTPQSVATNQSREAHQSRFPNWMRLKR